MVTVDDVHRLEEQAAVAARALGGLDADLRFYAQQIQDRTARAELAARDYAEAKGAVERATASRETLRRKRDEVARRVAELVDQATRARAELDAARRAYHGPEAYEARKQLGLYR
ncbi:MAG TPA: hypothetical protein VMG99_09100 [Thermoplasmata archaeon]|nr:hypothetical protein [Thermoplasmata archaeon]